MLKMYSESKYKIFLHSALLSTYFYEYNLFDV